MLQTNVGDMLDELDRRCPLAITPRLAPLAVALFWEGYPGNVVPSILLVMALVLPVALFWQLRSIARLNGLVAASIAVAAGWALSIAWATAAGESTTIAARFGWACPSALVVLTWLAIRFSARRAA